MSNRRDDIDPIENLPAEIKSSLQTLMVDRKCSSKDAYMCTERILGHVCPGDTYQLEMEGFIHNPGVDLPKMPEAAEPPHTVLDGRWESDIDIVAEEANILGGNGRYLMRNNQDEMIIKEAEPTPEHLAYYGSRLVGIGDALSFDTDAPLPVTIVAIGKTYAVDFLLNSADGGGNFLEFHNRPHFHMPLDQAAEGHLFIGNKDIDSQRKVSAFRVPYGFGIMMPPWVIHADSHLVGRYMVVYSVTDAFSTVTIRKSNGDLAKISVD